MGSISGFQAGSVQITLPVKYIILWKGKACFAWLIYKVFTFFAFILFQILCIMCYNHLRCDLINEQRGTIS